MRSNLTKKINLMLLVTLSILLTACTKENQNQVNEPEQQDYIVREKTNEPTTPAPQKKENTEIPIETKEHTIEKDKLVMFHNGTGPMCLEAVEFLETLDYPVRNYLIYDKEFREKLNSYKENFGESEGLSKSFTYYPMIFINNRAFSGFNEDIKTEILREIEKE